MTTTTNGLPKRIRQMTSLTDVQRAMNRIFAEARTGKMETADMARYGQFLNLMAGIIRATDLEERVATLEAINARLRQTKHPYRVA